MLMGRFIDHGRAVAAWKARWAKECLFSVVMGTLTAEAPNYSVIQDLAQRIGDLPLPKFAQGTPPKDASFRETMAYFMPIHYLHSCQLSLPLVSIETVG